MAAYPDPLRHGPSDLGSLLSHYRTSRANSAMSGSCTFTKASMQGSRMVWLGSVCGPGPKGGPLACRPSSLVRREDQRRMAEGAVAVAGAVEAAEAGEAVGAVEGAGVCEATCD